MAPPLRRAEWKRLGTFVALGAGAFLIAMVGAALVPLGWPDALRRSAHPTVFVPLATAITVFMLRRDASAAPAPERFNPWPVAWSSAVWCAAGVALLAATVPVFVIAFGLRWVTNGAFSGTTAALMGWAIFMTAAAEEIAFRGYAFWRLMRAVGFWPAQGVIAMLFIVSHLTLGGYTLLPALVGTVAGSFLYGAVFARTQRVAAPIALHTGWNVAQHLLLSPLDPAATPLTPRFPHPPSPGEYALMLAVVGLTMVAGTVAVLRFKIREEAV